MNLGVYISSFYEERLIVPCISEVLKVFPQVELIDLGSEDKTLSRVRQHFNIPIHKYKDISGAEWTVLKNEYASKHDWVFWIDGDEIYDQENLIILRDKINSRKYNAS